MNPRNWGRLAQGSFIVALIVLFAAVVSGIIATNTSSASSNDDDTPQAEVSLEDLTVRPGDILPDEARCASDEFLKNSLASSDLKWSDSVSTPFAATEPEAMFTELREELCGNPTLLLMTVEGLSAITVQDDVTIGDVNPWMDEFIETAKTDMFNFLTKKVDSGDDIFVTTNFQEVAELTNTVLLRLDVTTVGTEKSVTNWHVAAREGLAAGTIPIATLNEDQYKGEFLRFEYTLKGDDCPAFRLGFNVDDKRFATLGTNCEPGPTPTPTPTLPPPDDEPECPPEWPHGEWPVCKDDAGNTPDTPLGGGGAAPDQPDPVGPPAAGEPPETYTPAPSPEPTGPPEGSTPDPDPAPSPEPSAAPEEDPEIVCLAPSWDPTYCD